MGLVGLFGRAKFFTVLAMDKSPKILTAVTSLKRITRRFTASPSVASSPSHFFVDAYVDDKGSTQTRELSGAGADALSVAPTAVEAESGTGLWAPGDSISVAVMVPVDPAPAAAAEAGVAGEDAHKIHQAPLEHAVSPVPADAGAEPDCQ